MIDREDHKEAIRNICGGSFGKGTVLLQNVVGQSVSNIILLTDWPKISEIGRVDQELKPPQSAD